MPSHPVALAIIKASGCFIAAPSANKASRPSPTTAQHVAVDFDDGSIDYIVDDGPVDVGIESTVVDVTGPKPVILRPGGITPDMIKDATGLEPDMIMHITELSLELKPRAPGMKYRHYAPKAPMNLVIGEEGDVSAYILAQVAKEQGRKVGILVTNETMAVLEDSLDEGSTIASKATHRVDESARGKAPSHEVGPIQIRMELGSKHTPEIIARNLYASLRQFDMQGVDVIYAEGLPNDGLGIAIMDRMKKAAEGRVVHA